ncbi:MAG TPA: DDE-type integrase/transposase/recombinase [Bacteroidia bacterium]
MNDLSLSIPTQRRRRKIHTNIKFLLFVNALPPEYTRALSRSQQSRYKNSFNAGDYFGNELSNIEQKIIAQMRQLNEHETDRKVLSAYLRTASVFRNCFLEMKNYKFVLKKNQEKFVSILKTFKSVLSVRQLSRLLKTDESTVYNWIRVVRVKCTDSIIHLCRKQHPNQLLSKEVDQMKAILLDETKANWPLVSLYYFALNSKLVSMSLSTWYKYAALLDIKRLRPKSLKHYGESIVGNYPNHYWHADVTLFRTEDRVLHYIYLVIDNYSRKILSWDISTRLSGELRMNTFREATNIAVASYTELNVNLIVDGGSENNNKTVDGFLNTLKDASIVKEIALKTVHFSNSMAEATNKIIKTYYLNQKELRNTKELNDYFPTIINDINAIRPHGKLAGLTPDLVYSGIKPDKHQFRAQKQTARQQRIEINKNTNCCKVWTW